MIFVCACAAVAAITGCDGSASSLAAKLQAEYPSERICGCIAAAERKDMSVLRLLVARLDDPDADVRLFAIGALRRLTGQTLGYRYFDDAQERAGAVRRWREWLSSRGGPDGGG